MQNLTRTAGVLAAAFVVSLAGQPAVAGGLDFAAEVDSCIAAVNDRVDLQRANRVRHLVTESRKTAIGYALTIETSVYLSGNEERYAVYCLARGNNDPLKLRITPLSI